jgi:hypothetical protein
MVIWWGPELVLIYNDAWVQILGPAKHPALGEPGELVWPEMWHIIGAQLPGVLDSGQATWSDDQLLPAMRHGYLEEAYFTYSYSPIRDETGGVAGCSPRSSSPPTGCSISDLYVPGRQSVWAAMAVG